MVPEGTNSAASFPSNCAAISWRRLTQGSSPKTSSPTSASAMARRIPGEGLVTVSLRRSIMLVCSLAMPLAAEHFDGGASHIDLIISVIPFEFQAPAYEVSRHTASSTTSEVTGHCSCRGSRAAGKRFARAAFPDPHREHLGVEDTHKLGVHALREGGMMLKARAPRRDVKGLWVVHEYDTVRVSHRDRSDLERSPIDHERFAQHPSRRTLHRNLSPFQPRLAHLHTDLVHDPTARKQL